MRWDESVKRGKIVSFSDNVKWSSKNLLKMISADTKTDVKQEIKELVAVPYFHRSTFSKLEVQYKIGLYFLFNLGWHSIQLDIDL